MIIDVNSWEDFQLSDLFTITAGKYHYPSEYEDGNTNYLSATEENNGVQAKISLPPDFKGNCIITGKVKCPAFYQKDDFCATSDVNILRPKFLMNEAIGLFIATIIRKSENFRWNYGRQCRINNTKRIVIKLPIAFDENHNPIVDKTKHYNKANHVPDFDFMDEYMHSLSFKTPTTKIEPNVGTFQLDTSIWKIFYLHKIFDARIGNGLDSLDTTSNNPSITYITRKDGNNGIRGKVDLIDDIEPFKSGSITLALGGSIGSCFLQKENFYTGQNVAVLAERKPMSDLVKLFLITLIEKECKIKFIAFGRELNAHYKKDFTLKLPIKCKDGKPQIDNSKFYSDDGYIPDWDLIEKYMKSLPFSDAIESH